MKVRITPPPAPGVKAVLVLAQLNPGTGVEPFFFPILRRCERPFCEHGAMAVSAVEARLQIEFLSPACSYVLLQCVKEPWLDGSKAVQYSTVQDCIVWV